MWSNELSRGNRLPENIETVPVRVVPICAQTIFPLKINIIWMSVFFDASWFINVCSFNKNREKAFYCRIKWKMLSQIILCSRTAHYHWSSKHQKDVSAVIDKKEIIPFLSGMKFLSWFFFFFLVITHECSHWFLFPLGFHIRGDEMVFFYCCCCFVPYIGFEFFYSTIQ